MYKIAKIINNIFRFPKFNIEHILMKWIQESMRFKKDYTKEIIDLNLSITIQSK